MKTQDEKDFRQELQNLLEKWGATISIQDTDIVDYADIPSFGSIYKKIMQVEIGGERGYGKPGLGFLQFEIGDSINKDKV